MGLLNDVQGASANVDAYLQRFFFSLFGYLGHLLRPWSLAKKWLRHLSVSFRTTPVVPQPLPHYKQSSTVCHLCFLKICDEPTIYRAFLDNLPCSDILPHPLTYLRGT